MSGSSDDGGVTLENKKSMVAGMIALHGKIQAEIEKEVIDPAHLMRLQGAALNQCLIALCAILSPESLDKAVAESDDPSQLKLFAPE
jgi:hypothetical protein